MTMNPSDSRRRRTQAKVVVHLDGGLGNQMFQYAAGRAASIRTGSALELETSLLGSKKRPPSFNRRHVPKTPRELELGVFNLPARFTRRSPLGLLCDRVRDRFAPVTGVRIYRERNPYVFDDVLVDARTMIFKGYFQSERYFSDYSQTIRSDFRFKDPDDEYAPLLSEISSVSESVGVLVRRSDYLALGGAYVLDEHYFVRAFDMLRHRLPTPTFFVFTIGDTGWAQEHFGHLPDVQIIENTNPDIRNFEKMRALATCRHAVIGNSSFGWWGAWLNPNPAKIVIVPKRWTGNATNDRYVLESRFLPNWIAM